MTSKEPYISAHNFVGKFNGKNTHLITLRNSRGMQVALTDYGARIVSIVVPDKKGNPTDVVLGFASIADYLGAKEKYHGACIGRYANRIGNGEFQLDGTIYHLAKNNGTNSLHGGEEGFHNQVWDRQVSLNKKVDFYYVSADGEEGFPGSLKVHVSYELTEENEVKIKYRATTDKKTVVNLTNHAYFNLNGEGNGDVLNHHVEIPSSHFFPVNENQLPLSEPTAVEGTPFDFQQQTKVVELINAESEQLSIAKGFDHTYVNERPFSQYAAYAFSELTGIILEVYTTEPSVHFYTGNHLNTVDIGKNGQKHLPYGGLCFEAQHYPNSPNEASFPSVVLDENEEFTSETTYKFCLHK